MFLSNWIEKKKKKFKFKFKFKKKQEISIQNRKKIDAKSFLLIKYCTYIIYMCMSFGVFRHNHRFRWISNNCNLDPIQKWEQEYGSLFSWNYDLHFYPFFFLFSPFFFPFFFSLFFPSLSHSLGQIFIDRKVRFITYWAIKESLWQRGWFSDWIRDLREIFIFVCPTKYVFIMLSFLSLFLSLFLISLHAFFNRRRNQCLRFSKSSTRKPSRLWASNWYIFFFLFLFFLPPSFLSFLFLSFFIYD